MNRVKTILSGVNEKYPNATFVESSFPEIEDDMIELDEKKHIQIGYDYMDVVTELPNGSFSYIPTNTPREVFEVLGIKC